MEVTASGLDKNQRDTRSNERKKKKKKRRWRTFIWEDELRQIQSLCSARFFFYFFNMCVCFVEGKKKVTQNLKDLTKALGKNTIEFFD